MKYQQTNKYLTITFSLYLILTSLVSIFLLLATLFQNHVVDFISIIALVVGFALAIVTFINNFLILNNLNKVESLQLLVNIFLCILQSIVLFSDGFYFKYTQGFESILFMYTSLNGEMLDVKMSNRTFIHDLIFKFDEFHGLLIGVNFIAAVLILFYILKYKFNKISNNTY